RSLSRRIRSSKSKNPGCFAMPISRAAPAPQLNQQITRVARFLEALSFYAGSMFAGIETSLGPLVLGFGAAETGQFSATLTLGARF
ncbi:MAG: hypothetical protein AAGC57_19625, partial [Pseudomonadota bacterium]